METGTWIAVGAASVPVLVAVTGWLVRWRRNRRANPEMEFVRLAYGSAELLIWNESGADATDIAVTLKYERNLGCPAPLKSSPWRTPILRTGAAPMHIPIIFCPELVSQPLTATIDFTDRTGRPSKIIGLTWGSWTGG